MRRNFISLTVFVSSLLLSPFTIAPLNANTQIKSKSISITIASILHKRGIDEDAAEKISKSFIGENEELFSIMLRNLINDCSSLNQKEILDFISDSALHKKTIDLSSYASLIKIVQKVNPTALNQKTMQEIEKIAGKNSLYLHTS